MVGSLSNRSFLVGYSFSGILQTFSVPKKKGGKKKELIRMDSKIKSIKSKIRYFIIKLNKEVSCSTRFISSSHCKIEVQEYNSGYAVECELSVGK